MFPLFYFLLTIPLAIVGGIAALVFGLKPHKKILSPEKSEKTLAVFKSEIARWLKENIISQEQAERILAKYAGLTAQREAAKRGRLIKIFSIFGSVLIGVGVILLIAANWRVIPPFVHTLLLILATVATYFLGWWFKYQRAEHPTIGKALILLGCLLFGASLILIAQLYHLRLEYSNLILIWALAILPLAFFDKSQIIAGLSGLAVSSWGMFALEALGHPEEVLPLKYYLSLLLLLFIFMPLAYWLKWKALQGLSLVLALVWLGPISALKWFSKAAEPILDICLLFLSVGMGIFLLGEVHNRWQKYRSFKTIYFPLGMIVVLLASFILTFPQVYKIGGYAYGRQAAEGTPFMPVFFNFVLFAEICLAIYLGIRKEENYFVNCGIVFFALLVIARYFCLTWSLSSRSLVFIVGGVLLIGGSYLLDKLRKKLLGQIKKPVQIQEQ